MTTEHADKGIFISNEDVTITGKPNWLHSGPKECPKCHRTFKNAVALRMHNVRKHSGRGWDTSKNFHKRKKRGVPWRAGQLEKFQATMRKKAAAKRKPKAERIQIVYPDPREEVALPEVHVPTLKYCPACGEPVERWKFV